MGLLEEARNETAAKCQFHGIGPSTAYTKRKCRCAACRAWARAYYGARRADPKTKGRIREAQRRWRETKGVGYKRKLARKWRGAARKAVADFYGLRHPGCMACGATSGKVDIHHRNGDGQEHRDRFGGHGYRYYRAIASGEYSMADLALLCARCHGQHHRRST